MSMYREPEFDDTTCDGCGRKLPETVEPFSWADNGWHRLGCALRFGGALDVRGTVPTIELARVGNGSGPGFEEELVRQWRAKVEARPGAQLALRKMRSENDPNVSQEHDEAWSWRVYLVSETGAFAEECLAFRLTPRDAHACDEHCRGCFKCYQKTGDTICSRVCPHHEENHPAEDEDEDEDECADCARSYGPGAKCRCHDAADADDPEDDDDDLKCFGCERLGPRCDCGEPIDFHE